MANRDELDDAVGKSKKSEPHILLWIYEKNYKLRHNRPPRINKYRDKWAMQEVIDSVGYVRAEELINYYFEIDRPDHSLQFFLYNFDKMDAMKRELDKDKVNRKILLAATKKMVEEEE